MDNVTQNPRESRLDPLLATMEYTDAIGGRLCARLAGKQGTAQQTAVVGVVQFPPSFVPQEDAMYLAISHGNRLSVNSSIPLEFEVSADIEFSDISTNLVSSIWKGTKMPDTFCIRFRKGFEKENIWVAYGAANQPLLNNHTYQADGHLWVDVAKDGSMSKIEGPLGLGGELGENINQLIHFPVWPGAGDEMYSYPTISTRLRDFYYFTSNLQVLVARNELSMDAYREFICDHQDISRAHISLSPASDFMNHLSALEERGLLKLARPMTVRENEEAELIADQILQKSMPDMTDYYPRPRKP